MLGMFILCVALSSSSGCCGVTRIGAMEKILTYFETATPSAIFHYYSVCVLFTVTRSSSTSLGFQKKNNTRSLPIRTLAPTSMNFIPPATRCWRRDLRPNVLQTSPTSPSPHLLPCRFWRRSSLRDLIHMGRIS